MTYPTLKGSGGRVGEVTFACLSTIVIPGYRSAGLRQQIFRHRSQFAHLGGHRGGIVQLKTRPHRETAHTRQEEDGARLCVGRRYRARAWRNISPEIVSSPALLLFLTPPWTSICTGSLVVSPLPAVRYKIPMTLDFVVAEFLNILVRVCTANMTGRLGGGTPRLVGFSHLCHKKGFMRQNLALILDQCPINLEIDTEING